MRADSFGARLEPAATTDEFKVQWYGVFDKNGLITDSVIGNWEPRSQHLLSSRSRVHKLAEVRTTLTEL
eukprot:4807316-Pleurochrysis_carterae.AAC.1